MRGGWQSEDVDTGGALEMGRRGSRPLQISRAHFVGEPRRLAVPGDTAVVEHIDAVGVRQRESNVLFGEQERERMLSSQALDRLGEQAENDRRKAQRRLVEYE